MVIDRIDGTTEQEVLASFVSYMTSSHGKQFNTDKILSQIGSFFDADRAYIFEQDDTKQFINNTYEWCGQGISAERDNLQCIPYEFINMWVDEFKKNGCFLLMNDEQYASEDPIVSEILQPQGIECLMAAPLTLEGTFVGFLGVDNPRKHKGSRLILSIMAATIYKEILHERESSLIRQLKDAKEELERAQENLEEARRTAEAANKAKTSFLFNMSHDIRTPMNAIMGFTNLLQKNIDDRDKAGDYIRKIQNSNGFLLSLINNILEMARIESGKMILNEEVCDVKAFDDQIVSVFSEHMNEKGISFSSNVTLEHPVVMCDMTKIKEVSINLLSNAMKYTNPGGSVHMEITELPCDREGYVQIKSVISDTGIGMSEEYKARIFEEFTREHNSTESKVEGTGLGMAIVKSLVDLMGGSISVESQLGVGTSVTVILPHRIADAEEKNNESDNPEKNALLELEGRRVLLAEDNDLNAEIAISILEEEGLVVELAEDGAICVDMLANAPAGYYNMILMDVQMPNKNGYEATHDIRAMSDKAKSEIPIIAMTANAFEEDKKAALESGMNGHLAKPIDIKMLFDIITEMIN